MGCETSYIFGANMQVEEFDEISDEFLARVARIVWATLSSQDTKGRLRSRLLHPIWEGSTGWILTGRRSLKAKHIAANPYVSITYWDQEHEQIMADCRASWEEDVDEKQRVWDLFKSTEPPLGYDPGMFFTQGAAHPECGLLKLVPWRVELWSISDLMNGKKPQVWQP